MAIYPDINDVLNEIETENGQWRDSNDGRSSTTENYRENGAEGFKARWKHPSPRHCVHGGDYGWGPDAPTQWEAVAMFLAEQLLWSEEQLLELKAA